MTHRHYTANWPRCRDCGAIAGDCSEYCDDCQDDYERDEAEALEAGQKVICNGHAGTIIEICQGQMEGMATVRVPGGMVCVSLASLRPTAEADCVPAASECTCRMPYVPSAALEPPEPILDRYCPVHGDGGPDPDHALEARRDQIRQDRHFPLNSED